MSALINWHQELDGARIILSILIILVAELMSERAAQSQGIHVREALRALVHHRRSAFYRRMNAFGRHH